ncbi:acyl-CoA thioesterase [Cellulomonas fimi]|uniref:Thioesterase superfamily protein n=1 Tax=Cellulomonas fimi (strain ATCC 484 / DSM 20113 / JCM 1341 / CCUG 24087 / LMG 16345 / NBRC 15513 / NCIMB 8980 / NCTC 7547 / NRS-133) TaxID=590998 RepID=F4H626_CELFA|nr:thioesterase family protein [Cellulomonas fimi]AEE46756.1 thioesterase superfamily protein [Cellulomonas fimi ATCC 484]NNH07599.1 acyl-CoA thioesterase [Cellulomonas fimi]VEH34093.1 Acyl-ACP thioesterase [Cellulomonas fimi]
MTYPHRAAFPTRWNDNDQYGHMNNAVYYEAMDTTINVWLLRAGLDPLAGGWIAVCAASSCEFRESASFPEPLEIGLRAGRVGTTSVTWELGILRPEAKQPLATGRFVHVFVDRASRRPVPVPDEVRAAISRDLAS